MADFMAFMTTEGTKVSVNVDGIRYVKAGEEGTSVIYFADGQTLLVKGGVNTVTGARGDEEEPCGDDCGCSCKAA